MIKIIYRAFIKYPAFLASDYFDDFLIERRRRRWIRQLRFNARQVHRSLQLIGHLDYERISIGAYCQIDKECTFWLDASANSNPSIHIGERTYLGRNCYLGSRLPLEISSDCLIGAYTYITTSHHEFHDSNRLIRDQGLFGAPVKIGPGSWIGAHVLIMPGVTIGEGAIVGGGAVVTHDIPPGEIWGGVPARKIGQR